jgi:hypothetical protein
MKESGGSDGAPASVREDAAIAAFCASRRQRKS